MLRPIPAILALTCLIGCAAESPTPSTASNPSNTTETAPDNAGNADTSPEKTSAESEVTPVKYSGSETLTVNVPDMHCPFACYPKVKQTLAEQKGVESVDLVEQEEEGVINDPRVIVKLNGDFDKATAFDALTKAGFSKAEVVSTN